MRIRRLTPQQKSRFSNPASDPVPTELSEHELLAMRHSGYQQALYQAWFATGLEQTKSMFTLSSAGVGLALTLIYGDHMKGLRSWAPLWLLFAAVAFAVSAVFCIWVLRVNGKLVAKLTKDQDSSTEDGLAGRVDMASRILFGSGLTFLIVSAIAKIWL